MSSTLAVLITYFNEAELLTECLNSLLANSSQPDEILVYDDASQTLPNPYIPAAAKVKIIRAAKNTGAGPGRNVLMEQSQCDYVHIQDADDLFALDWCAKVRHAIESGEPDVVFTDMSYFVERGSITQTVIKYKDFQSVEDVRLFSIEGILLIPSTTFKRQLGLAVGGYRPREVLKLAEDYDFHSRLMQAISSFSLLPEPLIYLRLRPNSNSRDMDRQFTPDNFICLLKAISLLAQELPPQYHPSLAEQAARYASQLYRIGCLDEAQQGFTLAHTIGTPAYSQRGPFYGWLARNISPMIAERLSAPYIQLVPEQFRRKIRAWTGD